MGDRELLVMTVYFKRSDKGPWETGVFIGRKDDDPAGVIYDFDLSVVTRDRIVARRDNSSRGSVIFRE